MTPVSTVDPYRPDQLLRFQTRLLSRRANFHRLILQYRVDIISIIRFVVVLLLQLLFLLLLVHRPIIPNLFLARRTLKEQIYRHVVYNKEENTTVND